MNYRLAALALIVSILAPAPAVIAAPTADEELYTKTVATMSALPKPANITFTANLEVGGVSAIDLTDARGFLDGIKMWAGAEYATDPGRGSWPVSYRTNDDIASIVYKRGHHFVAHSPDFSPTWNGVFVYGLAGRPNAPELAPPEPADSGAVVAGIAQVIGIDFYRVTQAGATKCPGGTQGRRLHLAALSDPLQHPLTDATIDVTSERFCSMRFSFGRFLDEEVHFGDVNGYWMTTSMVRTHKVLGQYFILRFAYQDVRYPDTLDEALFVPQT